MPEIAPLEILVLAGLLLLGIVLGWIFRGGRCAKEKIAVNAGWQEQLESQRTEHDRLAQQNKSLMEQISQYQASMKDSNLRAKELSDSLKDTFERRDILQRQLKEVRGNLDVAIAQRNKLQTEVDNREARDEVSASAIREKDDKIFRLSRELTTWQSRVPPLVDRYRERDLEVQQLTVELQQAKERIADLETGPDHTRIEPVDPNTLADGLNASNDPLDGDASGQFQAPPCDQNESYDTNSAPQSFVDKNAAEPDIDDLKLIKGVGPAIEKTLNDLGIYRFNQIAEMSEFDIDRVAQRLKGFRSRIYREDWVGQARSLQYQKNNDLV